jgi:hypothetical protein
MLSIQSVIFVVAIAADDVVVHMLPRVFECIDLCLHIISLSSINSE